MKKDRREMMFKLRVNEEEMMKINVLAKRYNVSKSQLIRLLVECQFDAACQFDAVYREKKLEHSHK